MFKWWGEPGRSWTRVLCLLGDLESVWFLYVMGVRSGDLNLPKLFSVFQDKSGFQQQFALVPSSFTEIVMLAQFLISFLSVVGSTWFASVFLTKKPIFKPLQGVLSLVLTLVVIGYSLVIGVPIGLVGLLILTGFTLTVGYFLRQQYRRLALLLSLPLFTVSGVILMQFQNYVFGPDLRPLLTRVAFMQLSSNLTLQFLGAVAALCGGILVAQLGRGTLLKGYMVT